MGGLGRSGLPDGSYAARVAAHAGQGDKPRFCPATGEDMIETTTGSAQRSIDPATSLEWASVAIGRLNNIDSERLLSALLDGELAAPSELLHRIADAQFYDPKRVPA